MTHRLEILASASEAICGDSDAQYGTAFFVPQSALRSVEELRK